jgi:hypothetical protein
MSPLSRRPAPSRLRSRSKSGNGEQRAPLQPRRFQPPDAPARNALGDSPSGPQRALEEAKPPSRATLARRLRHDARNKNQRFEPCSRIRHAPSQPLPSSQTVQLPAVATKHKALRAQSSKCMPSTGSLGSKSIAKHCEHFEWLARQRAFLIRFCAEFELLAARE